MHEAAFSHDLPAHDAVYMLLQRADFAGNLFDPVEGHDADLRLFQRNGVAGVLLVGDAIEAHDLAGHLKAGDLITAVLGGLAGLEKPSSYYIQRGERLAVVKQGSTSLDTAALCDQLVDPPQFHLIEPDRHAQLTQTAVGASDFDGFSEHLPIPTLPLVLTF